MTALLADSRPDNLWATMPGWGIVADLTPPELVESRRLLLLRKQLAAGLVLVVLLCVAGYVWASTKTSAADDRLAAATAQTQRLTQENSAYAAVVAVQTATQGITGAIATLMASDVDVATLVQRLHSIAPAGTTLTTVDVSMTATSAAASSPLSSEPVIGSLTLAGTSRHMIDVGTYVSALQKVRGVVSVVPSSNTAGAAKAAASWTMTAQLTDKLYSHRFDPAPTSGGGTTTTGGH